MAAVSGAEQDGSKSRILPLTRRTLLRPAHVSAQEPSKLAVAHQPCGMLRLCHHTLTASSYSFQQCMAAVSGAEQDGSKSRILPLTRRTLLRPAHVARRSRKVGRRTPTLRDAPPLPPHLDSFEPDGNAWCGRDGDQREDRFRARINRATTLYPVGPRTRTMMQPCVSAAKLRSGGTVIGDRHKRTDWAETVGCLQQPPFIAPGADRRRPTPQKPTATER